MKKVLKNTAVFIISIMMFSGKIFAQWTVTGANISNNNTGNVGIGTAAPSGKLHINTTVNNASALNITGSNPYLLINSTSVHTSNVGKDLNIWAYAAPGITIPPAQPPIPGNLLLQAPVSNVLVKLGNVGIGTAFPVQKLHVAGASILATNTTINPNITANSVIAGSISEGPNWSVVSGIGGKGSGAGSAWAIGTTGTGLYLGVANGTADNSMRTGIQIMSNSNVLLVPVGGNVGIGANAPAQKLHVAGASVLANSSPININTIANSVVAGGIHDGSGGTSVISGIGGKASGAGTGWAIGVSPTAMKFNFSNGSSDNSLQTAMEILGNRNVLLVPSTGNVGIGVITPVVKLDVGGTIRATGLDVCGFIRARDIRVQTGWCDYVFENNYKLPALRDVEAFIKKNKHLPDVTPGPEIENNGLEVGKVASQMIKKIEELTLYVIELQKQVDDLKNNQDKN